MMAINNRLAFAIAFCVLVRNNFSLVETTDECYTDADCTSPTHCCGGSFGNKERRCTYVSCLYRYCSVDSDCRDSSMCCRSNTCVRDGCSGCTNDTDCSAFLGLFVCCKKTFPLDQTVCGLGCINETCNWNDDCGASGGYSECCRSGKCVDTGCDEKCTSDSECDLGQYCCKKENSNLYWDSCSVNCIGKICSTDDDCGGPQECCISNKCVTSGCSGCTTNSNCSTGHYCCKTLYWVNECSADCVGKPCYRSDDCGGPSEVCDAGNRCAVLGTSKECSKTFPPWVIAVIVASIVVFLIAVGIFVAVFRYFKRVRPANATRANRGTVSLQNTQYRGAAIQDPQPSTQFPAWNNPAQYQGTGFQNPPQPTATSAANATRANRGTMPLQNSQYRGAAIQDPQPGTQFPAWSNPAQYQGTGFQNQPQQTGNVAYQSFNLPYHPQGMSNPPHQTPHEGITSQNPPQYTLHQGNKNSGFCDLSQGQHHQPPMSSSHNQHTKVDPSSNPPYNPFYRTLEPSDTAHEVQYPDNTRQQMYPQDTPNQGQSNDYPHYPPGNNH